MLVNSTPSVCLDYGRDGACDQTIDYVMLSSNKQACIKNYRYHYHTYARMCMLPTRSAAEERPDIHFHLHV